MLKGVLFVAVPNDEISIEGIRIRLHISLDISKLYRRPQNSSLEALGIDRLYSLQKNHPRWFFTFVFILNQ